MKNLKTHKTAIGLAVASALVLFPMAVNAYTVPGTIIYDPTINAYKGFSVSDTVPADNTITGFFGFNGTNRLGDDITISTGLSISLSSADVTNMATLSSSGSGRPFYSAAYYAPGDTYGHVTINGNIAVSLTNILPQSYNGSPYVEESQHIYGYYAASERNDYDSTSVFTVNGNVTMNLEYSSYNSKNTTWGFLRAINQSGTGTLYVNGDVDVTLSNVNIDNIDAILATQGTVHVKGSVKLTLKDVFDTTTVDNVVSAVWMGATYNGFSVPASGSIGGPTEVVFSIGDAGEQFNQNIFGALLTYKNRGGTLSLGGDVSVSFTGDAANVDFYHNSVYGVVNGSNTASYAFAIPEGEKESPYKRVLNFGTPAEGDTAAVTYLSADYGSGTGFQQTQIFSFSNFDVINVNAGSNLVLTVNNQVASLWGDDTVFYDITGEVAGTGYVELDTTNTNADRLLDGSRSFAGRLELKKGSVLNINSGPTGAVNTIMQLQNEGIVILSSGSILTLTDTELTLGDTPESKQVFTGLNSSFIFGPEATLNIRHWMTYDIDKEDQAHSSNLSTAPGSFVNKGIIYAGTTSIDGASVENLGVLGDGTGYTLYIDETDPNYPTSLYNSNGMIFVDTVLQSGGTVTNDSNSIKVIDYIQTGGYVTNAKDALIKVGNSYSFSGKSLKNSGNITTVSFTQTEGTVTNESAGLLTASNYTLAGSASLLANEASGSVNITQTFSLSDGTVENAGVFSAKTIQIHSGTFTNTALSSNQQYLRAAEMSIEATGIFNNEGGYAEIDTLDGVLNNNGTVVNTGYLQATTMNMVGDFTAKVSASGSSTITSFNTANISIGELINQESAFMSIGTLNLSGGWITNSATIGVASLVQTGGSIDNTDLFGAGKMKVTNVSDISSSGTMLTADFTLGEDAEDKYPNLDVTGGYFYVANKLTLSSGTKIVGDGASLNGGVLQIGTGAIAEMNPATEIGSKVKVTGRLGFGEVDLQVPTTSDPASLNGSALQLAGSVMAIVQGVDHNLNISELQENLLGLSTRVQTGSTGFIAVGSAGSSSNGIAVASYSPSNSNESGLYFGSDSTLILATLSDASGQSANVAGPSASQSAFMTTAGTSLTVSSGANLIVQGDYYDMPERFYITSGYASSADALWEDGDTIKVVNQYGENYDYLIHSGNEDGTDVVYLAYYKQTPGEENPPIEPEDNLCDLGYVACHNIQTDIDHPEDPDPGVQAVIDIVGDESLPLSKRVEVMNSIANLPFAGGVMGVTMNNLMGDINELLNHLTMDSDTFGAQGKMWPYDEVNNIWLNVTGNWYNQRHLKASGIDRAGWKASAYGFILGYDRKLKDRPIAIGGAFSFNDGSVKSTGNISYTKNSYQNYGLHLWSNYTPNEHLNVIGALHWVHGVNDVKQNITGVPNHFKATGSMTSDWLALGVRFETSLSAGKFTFVPHIEPRYVYSKLHDFDTKIDGHTIWKTHAKGNSFFQIPVGIAARADFLTESGWTIRPNADVTVIPQVGKTSLSTQLSNKYGALDNVEGQFTGKIQTAVKIGLQVDRKNVTVGAKYGLVAGDRGRIDHGFILEGRWRF